MPSGVQEGSLLQSNQTVTLRRSGTSGASATAEFTIPSGGIAEIYNVTFKDILNDEDPNIDVTDVKITRRGDSQPVSLMDGDGTMNLREYAGDGRLPKIWPAVEIADQDSTLKVLLTNNDPSSDHDVSLTHNFRILRVPFHSDDKQKPEPKERLLMFNRTVRLAAGTESRMVFSAPKGFNAELKEITGWVTPRSDAITVKDVRIVRPGESEHIELIDGTMNFDEFTGDGKLSRPIVPLQVLRAREDMFVLVRNDEPDANLRVQLTVWMSLKPTAKD